MATKRGPDAGKSEVLSQAEIDQLLSVISSGQGAPERPDAQADRRKIKIYDFKRPDKLSKDQVRILSVMHEVFARLATNSLSARLRSLAQVRVASVDQLTFEEFTRSVPNPTTLAIVQMDPLKGAAILEIDPAVSFSIIDRLFGGSGEGGRLTRELTDIEQSAIEGVLVRMLGDLREAWASVVDLRPRSFSRSSKTSNASSSRSWPQRSKWPMPSDSLEAEPGSEDGDEVRRARIGKNGQRDGDNEECKIPRKQDPRRRPPPADPPGVQRGGKNRKREE